MPTDLKTRFSPPDRKSLRDMQILFSGRLVEKKGVGDLVSALPALVKAFPKLKLVVAGDGPDRAKLEQQAVSLGVERHIEFLGLVSHSDLVVLYRKSRVAVFPFRVASDGDQEGLGLVVVEAMGCECPVVVGDVPAVHDLVIDGETGLLVESGNAMAIEKKVTSLLTDEDFAHSMARSARNHVLAHFDASVVAEKYANLIASIIRQPRQ